MKTMFRCFFVHLFAAVFISTLCAQTSFGAPTYDWHTFYGSGSSEVGQTIAVDNLGNSYVAGWSGGNWNGPNGEAPLHAFSGTYNIFVLKLSSSGVYQWHTFYGSNVEAPAVSLALDGSGGVYFVSTSQVSFNGDSNQPPLNARTGGRDILVLKLNENGGYQWHSYYGSLNGDSGGAVVVSGG